MQAYVQTHISDSGIATISFSTEAHNSLPSHILQDLTQQIQEASTHENVKIIILRSGGERTFCAGASFDELKEIKDENEGLKFFSGFANVINACRTSSKIIIGRIQGKAVGGGVGLAAATDYCFATQYASIRLSELAIGIGPFVIAPAIERRMGVSSLTEMTLNPTKFYDATWGKQRGLYAELFENIEEMDKAISMMAETFVNYNPEALSLLKKVFWEGTSHWNTLLYERAAMSGKLVLSAFTKKVLNK